MSEPRLKYWQLAPEGLAKMRELEHYLNNGTGLEPSLLGLVRLRASLMNGCEYCVGLHTMELKKVGESEERIASVAEWRGSSLYTKRERAALADLVARPAHPTPRRPARTFWPWPRPAPARPPLP